MSPRRKKELAVGFFRLRFLPEVKPVYDFLKEEIKRLDTLNRIERDTVTMQQTQGACQVLESLIQMADASRDQIDKFDNMKAAP